MRPALPAALAFGLLLAACSSKADRQADALDNAANQADPAATAVMRNEAEGIRENGSDANLSGEGSPVQNAMSNAGAAAADSSANAASNDTQAKPHRPGDAVPPPQVH